MEHFHQNTCVDTKNATIGQCAVAIKTAELIKDHPEWSLKQVAEVARCIRDKTKLMFVVDDLNYLKAGGKLSSVSAFVGGILHVHPVIEIRDGYLRLSVKLRGSMRKLLPKAFSLFVEKHNPDKEAIWLVSSTGFSESLKDYATEFATEYGFKKIRWIDVGCIITTHGGPSSFAIAGYHKI